MERIVELYGPLRDLAADGRVVLVLPDDARASDVRLALLRHRAGEAANGGEVALAKLLERTVVAADEVILTDADAVGGARTLALLPPVCGG